MSTTADNNTKLLYAFDLETTSLRWDTGRVTTAAVCSSDGSAWVTEDDDERRLLRAVRCHFADLPAGVVVTWNGAVFDGPYLAGRADALGVERPCMLFEDRRITPKYEPQPTFAARGYHPIFAAAGTGLHEHVDVAYLWRDWADGHQVRWGLKPVAKALGVEAIEVDRTRMDDLSKPERIAYCLSDVLATLALAGGPEAFATDERLQTAGSGPLTDALSALALAGPLEAFVSDDDAA